MTDDNSRFSDDGNPAHGNVQTQVDPLGPVSDDYAYLPPAPDSATVPGDGDVPPAAKPPAGKSAARAVREIVETLLLALIIFVAVRALVLNFRVDGNSMVPNLQDQEMLLVNRNVYLHFDVNKWLNYLPGDDREEPRIVYPFHPPERGDIIVFNPPVESEKPYIKRVIALAGETVEIKADGYVYINGQKLDEPYIQGPITECTSRKCDAVTVPEGAVYVLGDNRRNSSDSRIFGPVDVDDIIGKAWLTYWPFDDLGLVPHYDYPGIPEQ
jgi:signal peptidase I